ncbi:MoxR family ATPase [Persicobacter sp. CCB-QB2]|uniref:AAA family ATPase n=1 Tax=Persicobacter sp. CCB-QB2 TaxID=1561025 RepID=UPI0006A9F3CE|nr:AAA family ATPase [Persicobacter sp. CCB-QB2]
MSNIENNTLSQINLLAERMNGTIIGQGLVVRRIIACLLADGNMLLEGLPGLAKTRAINSLAHFMDLGLSRVQFTPDLLPSDVTGTEIYQPDGEEAFVFQQGPIFNNLILADEINRAPAKVQAALLEAMQERQVTVAGTTHQLPAPFFVMATQNPIEQEGTYPLPEAQMDRFLLHVNVEYPSPEDELKVLRLVRSESAPKNKVKVEKIDPQVIAEARAQINEVQVAENIEKYIVDIIMATRQPEKYDEDLARWIEVGASPRATIGLEIMGRVNAWMEGRDFVTVEDIRAIAHDVLRHRISLSYEANADRKTGNEIVDLLLRKVAVA